MSRQPRRRASRRKRQPGRETAADQAYPIWVDVSGRRMFVVGYTSGGAPYGIFEDEMDADQMTLTPVTATSRPDSASRGMRHERMSAAPWRPPPRACSAERGRSRLAGTLCIRQNGRPQVRRVREPAWFHLQSDLI